MIEIVVLGGGFAGVAATLSLKKHLRNDIHITLVDKKNFHLFTPSLYEVATSEEPQKNIVIPFGEIFGKEVVIKIANVEKIDPKNQEILFDDKNSLKFDYLIIALGSEPEYFDIPGLKKYSLPLKKLTDAIRIREKVATVCKEKLFSNNEVSLIIGGGGFSGTELAAEFIDYKQGLEKQIKNAKNLFQVSIVEGTEFLLNGLSQKASEVAQKRLTKAGMKLYLGKQIKLVNDRFIELEGGKKIEYDIFIWTGGVKANHILQESAFQTNKKGQALVNEFLQIKDSTNIFAVGDCAEFIDPSSNKAAPWVAQIAEDEGKFTAENVFRLINEKPLLSYRALHYGYIVPLKGKYSFAELTVLGIHLTFGGILGWLLQQLIFMRYLLGILPIFKALSKWNKFERELIQD